MCTYVFVYQRACMAACRMIRTHSRDSNSVYIGARYGPDTLAIRRPTHGMIRRFVPVRAVKTRRRFGFKTVSFHVIIYSYIISLFTVVGMHLHVTLIISCKRLIYFTCIIICITL